MWLRQSNVEKKKSLSFSPPPSSQGYSFSSSHVWTWELDYKESWALKNWCFWIVVLEKTLESPFDCKEIQPVHPKGNHSWIFIGRTDAEAETPILWPPGAKSWLIGEDRCWERLKAGGEGANRGWDGWMASPTQWTSVWVNSGSWWWTGRPGVLQSMGWQRDTTEWQILFTLEENTHFSPHVTSYCLLRETFVITYVQGPFPSPPNPLHCFIFFHGPIPT